MPNYVFSVQEKITMVQQHFQGLSYRRIADHFAAANPDRPIPSNTAIRNMVLRFQQTGNVDGRLCKVSQPNKKLSVETKLAICMSAEEDPMKPISRIAEELEVSKTSVARVLRIANYRTGRKQHHKKHLPNDNKIRVCFSEEYNGQKSNAIAEETKKLNNREKLKLGNTMRQKLDGEKMFWIRNKMLANVAPYTPELAADLINRYICRNDNELKQITSKLSMDESPNREDAKRADDIRKIKKREEEEYETCGIEIPDIFDLEQCKMLRKWNGDLKYLPNFKFTRFGISNLVKSVKNETIKSTATESASTTCYIKQNEPNTTEVKNVRDTMENEMSREIMFDNIIVKNDPACSMDTLNDNMFY